MSPASAICSGRKPKVKHFPMRRLVVDSHFGSTGGGDVVSMAEECLPRQLDAMFGVVTAGGVYTVAALCLKD